MTTAAEPRPKPGRARAWAGRALGWWVGELAGLWRDVAQALGVGERGTVTIEAGERYWTVRQRQRVVGQIDRAGPNGDGLDRADAVAALAAAVPPAARATVIVEIPAERVLARTVTLPAAAATELDRIVPFEIARHFPFPADRMRYRYRIVGRPSGFGPIAVEIVAVPREIVAAIDSELTAAGLHAGGIALAVAGNAAPLFLPRTVLGASRPRRVNPVLAGAVGALALAAILAWPVAQHFRLAALDREIAALQPAAEAALRLRNAARGDSDRAASLIRLRAARPPLVGVLDALSRQVPDGSWLLSLSVSEREVIIDGLSPSAATIALALEHSHGFTAIDFRSPISRESNGLEHFQLGATLSEAAK